MKIIILDFSTSIAHVYDFPANTLIEDFLEDNGFREKDCHWLIKENLQINIH